MRGFLYTACVSLLVLAAGSSDGGAELSTVGILALLSAVCGLSAWAIDQKRKTRREARQSKHKRYYITAKRKSQ